MSHHDDRVPASSMSQKEFKDEPIEVIEILDDSEDEKPPILLQDVGRNPNSMGDDTQTNAATALLQNQSTTQRAERHYWGDSPEPMSTNPPDQIYGCHFCPKSFSSAFDLGTHILSHVPVAQNENSRKVAQNSETRVSNQELNTFPEIVKSVNALECQLCRQLFRGEVALREHLSRVHVITSPGSKSSSPINQVNARYSSPNNLTASLVENPQIGRKREAEYSTLVENPQLREKRGAEYSTQVIESSSIKKRKQKGEWSLTLINLADEDSENCETRELNSEPQSDTCYDVPSTHNTSNIATSLQTLNILTHSKTENVVEKIQTIQTEAAKSQSAFESVNIPARSKLINLSTNAFPELHLEAQSESEINVDEDHDVGGDVDSDVCDEPMDDVGDESGDQAIANGDSETEFSLVKSTERPVNGVSGSQTTNEPVSSKSWPKNRQKSKPKSANPYEGETESDSDEGTTSKRFKCHICSVPYKSNYPLNKHSERSHGESQYMCGCCHSYFTDKTEYTAHITPYKAKCTTESKYKCALCRKTFTEQTSYANHRKRCQANGLFDNSDSESESETIFRQFKCRKCNSYFKQETDYVYHKSQCGTSGKTNGDCELYQIESVDCKNEETDQNSTSVRLKCNVCSDTFRDNYALNMHGIRHHKPNQFQCKKCGEYFTKWTKWLTHKDACGLPTNSEMRPDGRNEIAETVTENLKTISKNRTEIPPTENCGMPNIENGNPRYTCTICTVSFFDNFKLNRHSRRYHRKAQYMCGKCGSYYAGKKLYEDHRVKCKQRIPPETSPKNLAESGIRCVLCKEKFEDEQSYISHSSRCTAKINIPSDISFEETDELDENHDQTQDTKRFKCNHCQVQFSSETVLAKHLSNVDCKTAYRGQGTKTHSKGTHKCSICSEDFDLQLLLAKHMLKEHNEGLPPGSKTHSKHSYKCSVCSETFSLQIELSKHMLAVHNEITTYSNDKKTGSNSENSIETGISSEYSIKTGNSSENPIKPGSNSENLIKLETITDLEALARTYSTGTVWERERPYTCDLCNYRTAVRARLKQHKEACHAEPEAYVCKACNTIFMSESVLHRHRKKCKSIKRNMSSSEANPESSGTNRGSSSSSQKSSETNQETSAASSEANEDFSGANPESCETSEERSSVTNHESSETLPRPVVDSEGDDDEYKPSMYKCDQCDKKYRRVGDLKRHKYSHLNKEVAIVCPNCDKFFASANTLWNHLNFCAPRGKHACSKCDKEYITKKSLDAHIKLKHILCEQTCDICGKTYSHPYTLEQHKKNMHFPKLQCDVCGRAFGTEGRMARHKKRHGPPTFPCEYCGKMFATKAAVGRHSKDVHATKKGGVTCSKCDASLKTIASLKTHMKFMHNNDKEKQFLCTQCPYSSYSSSRIQKHMVVHMTERAFKCDRCSKAFKTQFHLNKHSASHGTARPFECAECSASFKQQQHLRYHMLKHSGERAFQCSLCGKAFQRKQILDTHMLSHSGERPFECEHCEKRFLRKTDRNKHQREAESCKNAESLLKQNVKD